MNTLCFFSKTAYKKPCFQGLAPGQSKFCPKGFAEGLAPDEETEQVLQLELENGGTTHEHE